MKDRKHRRSPLCRGLAGAALLAVLAGQSAPAPAQKVYACPQPDAPLRYQDRPCAATPPAALPVTPPAATPPAATPPRRPVPAGDRAAAGAPSPVAPLAAPPSREPALPPGADPRSESRADYLARNERRCAAGDRRACAAVTCERSGGLGTDACQAALGYRRGAGWDLRPASDVFDASRGEDEYALRCTQGPRRARVLAARAGGAARIYAGTGEPTTVPLESIADFAGRYCAAGLSSSRRR